MDTYLAVIFSSHRTGVDDDGYVAMAARMDELAAEQSGYIGIETARDRDGFGLTVSYWSDVEAARAWKQQTEHLAAQELGRSRWYDRYTVRIARVEREYAFARPIFHLAMPEDWRAAVASGEYPMSTRGVTVAQEGFAHCSFVGQMRGVAERFYADVDELVILHLDRAVLDADLRLEPPADGIDELFPHVYRTIPTSAVTDTTIWRRHGERWGEPPVASD